MTMTYAAHTSLLATPIRTGGVGEHLITDVHIEHTAPLFDEAKQMAELMAELDANRATLMHDAAQNTMRLMGQDAIR